MKGAALEQADSPGEQRAFATTRWSLVLAGAKAAGDEEKARAALAELCQTYWRPIFAFISRRGYSMEDAQDLAQDFFVMVIEKDWLSQADANRGRFRSYLLKSVQNFLGHANERKRAWKRGGNVSFVSWDAWMAEAPSHLVVQQEAVQTMEPEQVFDLRWAATVVEQSLRRLQEECEAQGRRRLFDALSPYLTTERSDASYPEIARELSVTEAVVKKQLHLLRQRYRSLLREEVSHTVTDPSEIDDEIRHLCVTLATMG